ncbi:UTP--glucose-1-phosphate uridylyltransferase GalU [Thermaerobacillus caldiproteolyticus]|uniref:UTP--glucose-1-phosphate uridylyltransferase n=1 Tax=Thermaerobacillus caldiproteolyticus TaxID=247480 RepID=A0A7V9Z6V0_9BACL|nr:UTP--glucose-1-phosphate uridylyltransferase GalU [Anoxybacillus caldiproteolyticus]MBA2875157.1 UTP--glucose-1-phosphate uridylyltransferase [Anoxybacillus caldiproteolyticus]
MKIRKAVIPAAGLGTRFLPATKAQPKEMLPIVDKPAIQYIVEEAVQSGIENIIIVTGRNKRSIEDHFDRSIELEQALLEKGKSDILQGLNEITNMANIHFIRQKEPLGLGHAILYARHFIGEEPFAVLLGDDIIVSEKPALRQLMDVYEQYGTEVIGVQSVLLSEVNQYGIIDPCQQIGSVYEVHDLVEKPSPEEAPSRIAILGRYILKPSIFSILQTVEKGAGGEIQLTDALQKICEYQPIHALQLEGNRFDIGNQFGYLRANIEIGLQRKEIREQLLSYLENVWKREIC